MLVHASRFNSLLLSSVLLVLVALVGCGREGEMDNSMAHEEDFAIPPEMSDDAPSNRWAVPGSTPQLVYLNFDGAVIRASQMYGQDAQNNSSFIPSGDARIPAFKPQGFKTTRAAAINSLLTQLGRVFAPFNVNFTATRPAGGNYTMMMIGGTAAAIGRGASNMVGIAPLDGGNRNPNDIGFVFSDRVAAFGYPLQSLGFSIAHELAHSFGLEHINPRNDIMFPSITRGALIWGSGPMTDYPSVIQDDNAVLFANVGARSAGPAPQPQPQPQPQPPSGDVHVTKVQGWYRTYLGREAGPGEPDGFAALLRGGTPPNQVLKVIFASDEYFALSGGTNPGYARRAFTQAKGRAPTAAWLNSARNFLNQRPGTAGRAQLALVVLGG